MLALETCAKGSGSMRLTFLLPEGVHFYCLLRPHSPSVRLRTTIPPSPFAQAPQQALRGDKIFQMKMIDTEHLARCCLLLREPHSCVTSSCLEPSISQGFGLSTSW